ncbi:heat shock 70 kDa protein, mitochondrial-like isoform X2 [Papaver somniferum]|uniref:heat shock 70 kDa protein, mitochondrial-like isoform X2 n=1 Tax=Papaver somniferum TaxID=3469 RepID=UPI000E6FF997|nr:heat shock 70 kDa protein, mitochondrial-like isoform X2 [Papaver somniferum]
MATSVLLRLRLASVNSTDLVTRCLPGATPRRNTPLIQKWGNLARLFSSKPKPLGDDSDVIGVMEGKICTAADNQTQGEIAPDIKLLAEFRAMGFSPAPAKTMMAGKEQQNTIKLSGGLLESYIEDMIPEAIIVHERWRGADESTYSLAPYCNEVIGIDLGTIKSCVSVMRNNIPEVIRNSDGVHNIPSVVAFGPKGELLVGFQAKHQGVTNLSNTICYTKRIIGRRFDDPKTQKEMDMVPYKIIKAPNGDAWVEANGQKYTPIQIGAFVLTKMKEIAEAYLGKSVSKAVIAVPGGFSHPQRKATMDAGRLAGLDVHRIINETSAAALSYGLNTKDGIIAVIDLGGGTFDVSILEICNNVFEVKATSGDTFFGGVDFDSTLLEFLVSEIKRTDSIDLSKDRLALHRLREAAEKAKIELSSISQSEINLPFITANASGPKHLNITLTRPKLESLFNHLIQRTQNACRVCLKDAGVSVEDIHEVLCVGGMTRMPLVQEAVSEIFSSASIVVSPDDAVAMGAAIYGGIHHGYVKDVLLLEITARSIAVESFSGEVTTLINKNKFIPTTISTRFSTGDHNQTPVILRLIEGEDVATDFELIGVPYAPKGLPVIEVNLGLNSDGMIDISAKSTQFGKEEILGVELSDGTQSDNKSRMVIREAEQDIVQKCPTDMKRSADFLLKRSPNAVEPFIVDWRTEGAITPVMCQKKVGTCWACAAVSAVESKHFLTYGHLIPLSVQQVVDCATIDGCNGSNDHVVYRFIKFHGICSAEDYPYVAKSQSCELGKKSIVWIKGCVYVPVEAMEIIKAVSKQPLFACLTPEFSNHSDYYNYGGGPYYGGDKNVPIDVNPTRHAVCIVGHGNYKGEFFLILKDSKGDTWGHSGYMYLVITPDLAKQIEYVSYPVM